MTDCPRCLDHERPPPVDRDAPRVSVVVLHYEQHEQLARTLACLRRQHLPPVQVVVTDDGSRRPPAVPADVVLVRQDDAGFRAALARNRGLAEVTGDVVAFLDADTAPEPGYLARLAACVAAEPDVLAVGRRRYATFDAYAEGQDPLAGVAGRALAEPGWLTDGWASTDDLATADHASFRFAIGATLAASTGALRRLGGFDPTFTSYGGEDWDLAHRWWLHGGRLRHVSDAVAWHDGPHAGEEPRTWDAEVQQADRAFGEAVSLATRIHAWPVAFRGLRGARTAPPRVVLTHAPDVPDRDLVVSVDSALAALPQLGVVTGRPMLVDLGDPRVVADDALLRTAATEVHLHRGVLGDGAAWRTVAGDGRAAGQADTVRWLDPAQEVLLTTRALRRVRRSHLGLDPAQETSRLLPDGMGSAAGTTLDAWLGGWAQPGPRAS